MARIIEGNEMNLIGKKVRNLRKQKKLSQQALSDKLELMAVLLGGITIIYPLVKLIQEIKEYRRIEKLLAEQ